MAVVADASLLVALIARDSRSEWVSAWFLHWFEHGTDAGKIPRGLFFS